MSYYFNDKNCYEDFISPFKEDDYECKYCNFLMINPLEHSTQNCGKNYDTNLIQIQN